MSALINTGAIVAALRPGVRDWFGRAYNDLPEEWKEIFEVYSSNMAYEKDVGMSGFPLGVYKPEGEAVTYVGTQQNFHKEYQHLEYDLGFIITRIALEDNLYKQVAEENSMSLARSMRKTREIVCANVLNRAFTSGYNGADGVTLCNTAHLLGRGGTYSNQLSVGANLSEASLESALIQIGGFVDDANIILAVQGQKLIIHRNDEYEACRILQSNYQNDNANNAVNAMKYMGKLPQGVTVNHFLTDQNAWFIKTDVEKGFKYYDRRPLQIDSDTDFDSENIKFKATMRFSASWTDPRCVFGSQGG
jgi:hypothetical protein